MKKPIFFIGLVIIAIFAYNYYVNYQYEKIIGSHIENAYEVNTPERMINEINIAKEEMQRANLLPSDYGALIFKKPDNSMEFQYNFLDSIVERAEAVEIWYNSTYIGENTNTESLGDVYEQKMDNLREFLKEGGRADWIAKNTWYVKNHPIIYVLIGGGKDSRIGGVSISILILSLIGYILYKKYWEYF